MLLTARLAAGEKVAVGPTVATVPVTAADPSATVKVVAVSVVASIAVLKSALTLRLVNTPLAALAGIVEVTVGGVPVVVGPPNSTSCCPQPASDASSTTTRLFCRVFIWRSLPSG